MTAEQIITALSLPAQARVDQRVPKKHLLENGAPTAADKRVISEGVEELVWIAALKPTTIGVPAYSDELRQYLEIAVVTLKVRPEAKASRLQELVHRAIPYPLVLLSFQDAACSVTMSHLRHAQNEAGKFVLDGELEGIELEDGPLDAAFLASLPLAGLPQADLFALYQGWLDRLAALQAARYTGTFALVASSDAATRRQAIREITRLDAVIADLRHQAEKEPQLNRRVELNLELKRREAERNRQLALLASGAA